MENQNNQTSTQTSKKTPANLTAAQIFKRDLNKYESVVAKLLGEKMSAEKFISIVDNAVRKTPKLLDCDRASLFGAILTSAEMALEPNTPAGLSYIIPYKNQAQFQIGYHGVINLLYRSSKIEKIISEMVYENDEFDRYMDDSMNWRFKFRPATGNRGKEVGAFAIVHLRDTTPEFKYMSITELEEIKKKSQSPQTYDKENDPQRWMYRKAVIKQIAKLLPKGDDTVAITNALNLDSMLEGGATVTMETDGKITINKSENNYNEVSEDKLHKYFGKNATDAEVVN